MERPIYHLDKVVRTSEADMKDFDGPLDLILHLLSRHKIEIRDIRISLLLDQYLAWMERREQLHLEVASEFVAMAAHLAYIKTRMLLSWDDQEAISEMEQLMAALEEHRHHESYLRIREATVWLAQNYSSGSDHLTRMPEVLPTDNSMRYRHPKGDLLRAMGAILERMEQRRPPPAEHFAALVGREPHPVSEKARAIVQWLLEMGTTRFRALFASNGSRSEMVATFLAVLELCKGKQIVLKETEEGLTVTCTGEHRDGVLEVTADRD